MKRVLLSLLRLLRRQAAESDVARDDARFDDDPEPITYAAIDFSLYSMREFCRLSSETLEDANESLHEMRDRLGID